MLCSCVADFFQHHALAAPVFKAATRLAALTDPVRLAPTTADARRHDAGAFDVQPVGRSPLPKGRGAPGLQPPGETYVPCVRIGTLEC